MTPTAKQAAENHAAILRRSGPYERLRERYARGAISLERFEAEVVLLLRMSDALPLDERGAERLGSAPVIPRSALYP